MSEVRSPILPYATYNPVPDFIPFVDNLGVILLITEAGALFITEASAAIQFEEAT